jgi:hypothetical protein
MTIDIFLSLGRIESPRQQLFVQAVETLLAANGMRARTVGRTDFTHGKPLQTILEVMKSCSGTLVVAFERFSFEKGLEFPDSADPLEIADVHLPTVWNQIEAGMAYTLGQPLLAIAQASLRDEGLLEEGYDWFVNWVDLSPESLHTEDFSRTFENWKANVLTYAKNSG